MAATSTSAEAKTSNGITSFAIGSFPSQRIYTVSRHFWRKLKQDFLSNQLPSWPTAGTVEYIGSGTSKDWYRNAVLLICPARIELF